MNSKWLATYQSSLRNWFRLWAEKGALVLYFYSSWIITFLHFLSIIIFVILVSGDETELIARRIFSILIFLIFFLHSFTNMKILNLLNYRWDSSLSFGYSSGKIYFINGVRRGFHCLKSSSQVYWLELHSQFC